MVVPSNQDDVVRWIYEVEAKQALQNLRDMAAQSKKTAAGISQAEAKLLEFSKSLVTMSKKTGRPWKQILDDLVELDNLLSATAGKNRAFASAGFTPQDVSNLINAQEALGRVKSVSKDAATNVAGLGQSVNSTKESIGQLGISTKTTTSNLGGTAAAMDSTSEKATKAADSVKKTKDSMDKGSKSAKGFRRSIDVVRVALGTLTAMGVFRFFNFLEESFRKAIDTAKEYETSLYRLANVERILSQSGVETSFEGLKDVIRDVKNEFPIFSEADITQQVSLIGIMTKEFALTEEQIGKVAKAIGVLNIKSGESEDLLSTTNKVLTALVAPSGRGLPSLGLNFSKANIEAMAFKNEILEAGESFADLTEHEKDMLKIAILLESTGAELETIREFLKTNTGALAEQNAEWEDTLRVAGQGFLALKAAAAPLAIEILKFLQSSIQGFKAFIVILQAAKDTFMAFASIVSGFFSNPVAFIRNFDKLKGTIGDVFNNALEEGFNKFFSGQIPDDAPEWFKDLFSNFEKDIDAATESVEDLAAAIQSIEDVEGFEDLAKDLEKLQQKTDEINEDFAIKMSRMDEDYQIKRKRLIQDYNRKVEDVLRAFNRKREDINNRYRDREQLAELRFQERMRQLREKFLFDLEDALRERDARQVLRLTRQFQMDRQNLINENEIRKQEQAKQHQEDLQQAARDRDERLAQLAEEHAIRMQREAEDYQLRKEREELEHQRDLEDIRRQINERLLEFARAIAEEYGLNEEGANAIYQLLQQYYGPGGFFDGLYDYSYTSLVAKAKAMLDELNRIIAQSMANVNATIESGRSAASRASEQQARARSLGGQALGGTFVATKPTHFMFGEGSVPEVATITPLNQIKKGQGAGGIGGTLELLLSLSPDLEARMIRNTMSETANVIAKVQRQR